MPEWPVVSEWLRTTIPGIVLLGMLGSIVAYYVLKLFAVIGRRVFKPLMDRVLLSGVRPFSEGILMSMGFASSGRWAQLVSYVVFVMTTFVGNFVLFSLSLIATIIVIVHLGIDPPALPITLVTITGLLFIMFIRSFATMAGMFTVLFLQDRNAAANVLKDRETVFNVVKMALANQGTFGPPAATPDVSDQAAAAPTAGQTQDAPAEESGHPAPADVTPSLAMNQAPWKDDE